MTLEIGTQKVGRVRKRGNAAPAASTSLPIGEVDANIFACPACSRPLGNGTPRCPGCGTRLIAGVKASRALTFVGVGVFTGMIVSGGLMGIGSALSSKPTDVAVVPAPPIVTPTSGPIVSAAPPVVDPGVPSGAISALRQSTRLNQRVVADAERLVAALAQPNPSSADIAPVFRTLASTATFGGDLAPSVGEWDQASAISSDLDAFYDAIAGTANEALAGSLANHRSYKAAAEQMLEIIAGLEAIDADARALAASVDVELPPLEP